MAASGTLTLSGVLNSLVYGTTAVGPFTLTTSDSPGDVHRVVLQSGANTITLPTSPVPKCAVIILPTDNTATVTLKGVTGDTGIEITKTGWALLPFNTASLPASFVITSSATQTAKWTNIYWF